MAEYRRISSSRVPSLRVGFEAGCERVSRFGTNLVIMRKRALGQYGCCVLYLDYIPKSK